MEIQIIIDTELKASKIRFKIKEQIMVLPLQQEIIAKLFTFPIMEGCEYQDNCEQFNKDTICCNSNELKLACSQYHYKKAGYDVK